MRKDFWTYLIVTMVSVLIWTWAAAETREQRTLFAQLTFEASDPDAWMVEASNDGVALTVEGSNRALRRAGATLGAPVMLRLGTNGVPDGAGGHTVDVASILGRNPILRETGVSILTSDPPTLDLDIDELTTLQATVRPRLPGAQTEGEIDVDPPVVTITLPSMLRQRFPDITSVEALVDPARLSQLEPGNRYSLEVSLRPPDRFGDATGVRVVPSTATLSFTLRSRIRQTTLDSVRVQLAGPPESYREYDVELEETLIRNVTVSAEADLIRRIESGQATVVAIVHVSNRDKENGIQLKHVTYFLAMITEEDGSTEGIFVDATVDGSTTPPIVKMEITPVTRN